LCPCLSKLHIMTKYKLFRGIFLQNKKKYFLKFRIVLKNCQFLHVYKFYIFSREVFRIWYHIDLALLDPDTEFRIQNRIDLADPDTDPNW
jgi:hypothetical protein